MWKVVYAPIHREKNPGFLEAVWQQSMSEVAKRFFATQPADSMQICQVKRAFGHAMLWMLRLRPCANGAYAGRRPDPVEYAKVHKEFVRAFVSVPGDADKLHPG
jgi:steroid 5-alpha reductase family enzyme